MHEKLNEQIEAMDEKVAKIANACLDRLDKEAHDRTSDVKSIGDSLKALAEGLESYRIMTKNMKINANRQQ